MRRILLLALLALALPAAALATSFSFSTGTSPQDFQSATTGGGHFVTVTGHAPFDTISFDLDIDSENNLFGPGARLITGGAVTVKNPAGDTVFTANIAPPPLGPGNCIPCLLISDSIVSTPGPELQVFA